MEKLLDKSMAQTDEAVSMAQRFHDELVKAEAERDRLREINKELVEALRAMEDLSRSDLYGVALKRIMSISQNALKESEKTA
jgi:hypothetical protein